MATNDPNTWRRSTSGGIRYKLLEGYPKVTADESKASASERYLIRAADVNAFLQESIPAPVVYLGSVYWPERRRMPGASILVTRSLSFEPHTGALPMDPFDADSGAPTGTYDSLCAVTIQYETMQNESEQEQDPNDPETFLEHSVTTGGEFMSWPPANTKKQDAEAGQTGGAAVANKDPISPVVKTIPTIEHTLKWKNCLSPNWERIISYLGHVSSEDMPLLFDAIEETVLFMGVSGSQSYLWDGATSGVQPWTLDFRFSHKQIDENGAIYGWNHVYSPSDGGWRKLYRADGQPLFLSADLVKLFTV